MPRSTGWGLIREKEGKHLCEKDKEWRAAGGRVVNRERTIPRQNNGRQPVNESKRKKSHPPKRPGKHPTISHKTPLTFNQNRNTTISSVMSSLGPFPVPGREICMQYLLSALKETLLFFSSSFPHSLSLCTTIFWVECLLTNVSPSNNLSFCIPGLVFGDGREMCQNNCSNTVALGTATLFKVNAETNGLRLQESCHYVRLNLKGFDRQGVIFTVLLQPILS